MAARKTVLRKQPLIVQTRLANEIENEFNPEPPTTHDMTICQKHQNDFPRAIRRTLDPSYGYNCHGLTFAARRTQVWSSSEVNHILREDDYRPVSIRQALPGDIAVYFSNDTGEIEHSGLVVKSSQGPTDLLGPLVVSKWGPCQEFKIGRASCRERV